MPLAALLSQKMRYARLANCKPCLNLMMRCRQMATSQSLIHWPTQNQKPKSPVIPRSKVDPTMSRKSVSKMERDIEARYYSIKVALKALFDQRLTGREREVNSHNWHFLCHDRGEDVRLYGQCRQVHL